MARSPDTAPPGFEESFDVLFSRAFTSAQRLLPSAAASEDVAAEAMMRAYLHWRKIGEADWREGWVVRVASNLALDAIRKDKRLDRRRLDEASAGGSVSGRLDPDVAESMALATALGTLPKRQREVVVLRYLEGYPEKDVAAALRISPGSVKTHASRGLAAMREQLGPDADRWNDETEAVTAHV
ncbi:MAG: sigma-70 family RNA polymerase sigma factor [Acidimicrobiales bacterium]|nr:sigma-70 family RNA polymerase sigma factor [Acidimicrobiales bacterium]